ncbi:30S ribosomal protein S14 [Kytococcus sp. Marseille-QA3725]
MSPSTVSAPVLARRPTARNKQRAEVVARYAERRAELKRIVSSPESTSQERAEAVRALQKLPHDASPTRLRNRDVVDGRPRAVYRAFGLSRIRLREMAHAGELPGVTKSPW